MREAQSGLPHSLSASGDGATRASRALTNAALALDGITTVCIRCDAANTRSAAVPRRLGFSLAGTETRAPQTPAESGQLMTWERTEPC
jgi:RimJ/RimL family protein N-acetyltransferase